jgi:hypothetical protein
VTSTNAHFITGDSGVDRMSNATKITAKAVSTNHKSITPSRNELSPIYDIAACLDVAPHVKVLRVEVRYRCRRDEALRFVLGRGHDGDVAVLNFDVKIRVVAYDAPPRLW